MNELPLFPSRAYGRQFVPPKHLPPGVDEYYLRNQQARRLAGDWRPLRPDEIEALERNRNGCDDWSLVVVAEPFLPALIRNCVFSGLVRIGRLTESVVESDGLQAPVGLNSSRIVA